MLPSSSSLYIGQEVLVITGIVGALAQNSSRRDWVASIKAVLSMV
jgi:hypothetical protein